MRRDRAKKWSKQIIFRMDATGVTKQRGTTLKRAKNVHRGGRERPFWWFSAISVGGKVELFRGNQAENGRIYGCFGQNNGHFEKTNPRLVPIQIFVCEATRGDCYIFISYTR
jgi:hypothetical protein